ncbi:MAG TPA: SRPBCC family protein [Candidatus Limnocylindria bacterium]|nr:SRPBCC family protein [Candidatus Limnocylindria bacterium]
MIVDQKVTVPAPVERVWEFVMDVPRVAECVPGVESVEQLGEDEYLGALKVRVGPIGVRLEGKVTVVERNADEHRAAMKVEAADRRIKGAVNATSTMTLAPLDDGTTELSVHTDAAILGKLGEFGQAIMRRKADQIMKEFAQNMANKIEAGG